MAMDRTVVSSTPVSKYACVVTQLLNFQQTFSMGLSIGRHFPHTHQLLLQSTLVGPGDGCSMAFASSMPPLELNAWVIRSLHWLMESVAANSCSKFLQQARVL